MGDRLSELGIPREFAADVKKVRVYDSSTIAIELAEATVVAKLYNSEGGGARMLAACLPCWKPWPEELVWDWAVAPSVAHLPNGELIGMVIRPIAAHIRSARG